MRELLIITGSMGAGKTVVLAEAGDILASRRITYAAIDLDSLALANFSSGIKADEVMYANLRCVCNNYAEMGVQRFLVASALEGRAQLELCRQAVPAKHTVVCRLTASVEAMQHRVKMREPGMLQQELVARVAELERILDGARLEDFVVVNENRQVTKVALEVLTRAGWIST
jgi:predicted ABC-type ATPase